MFVKAEGGTKQSSSCPTVLKAPKILKNLKHNQAQGVRANQHTRELISVRKTSHKYNNKDLSRLR